MITVSTLEVARNYHHGTLRLALLEAGLAALEHASLEALSLRGLAREVGVSPTAVYRHFPDKAALLRALAEKGVEELGTAQQAAMAAAAGPDESFGAIGRAYVRWALANPALFRLVFTCRDVTEVDVFGQSLAARLLQSNALAASDEPEDTPRIMVQAWALVHGLAMLMLDGKLPADDTLIDAVIDPGRLFPLKDPSAAA